MPDMIIGCAGGGSNLGGLIAPFMGEKIRGERDYRIIAVEPESCPSFTRGKYAYDYCDTGMVCPLSKMYTLGSGFIPSSSHAGGLRRVPFDGYIAELHKGERVLTADEARAMDIPAADYHGDDDFYGDKPKSGGLVMYFYVTVTGNMDDESARRYGKLMGEKAAQELRAKGVTA